MWLLHFSQIYFLYDQKVRNNLCYWNGSMVTLHHIGTWPRWNNGSDCTKRSSILFNLTYVGQKFCTFRPRIVVVLFSCQAVDLWRDSKGFKTGVSFKNQLTLSFWTGRRREIKKWRLNLIRSFKVASNCNSLHQVIYDAKCN